MGIKSKILFVIIASGPIMISSAQTMLSLDQAETEGHSIPTRSKKSKIELITDFKSKYHLGEGKETDQFVEAFCKGLESRLTVKFDDSVEPEYQLLREKLHTLCELGATMPGLILDLETVSEINGQSLQKLLNSISAPKKLKKLHIQNLLERCDQLLDYTRKVPKANQLTQELLKLGDVIRQPEFVAFLNNLITQHEILVAGFNPKDREHPLVFTPKVTEKHLDLLLEKLAEYKKQNAID